MKNESTFEPVDIYKKHTEDITIAAMKQSLVINAPHRKFGMQKVTVRDIADDH